MELMTDIRARITDALREAIEEPVAGVGFTDGLQWGEHLADVLLSLDGIAIVELPTAEAVSPFSWLEGSVTATNGLGRVRCYLDDPRLPASEAREIAAALLAAANAAEDCA